MINKHYLSLFCSPSHPIGVSMHLCLLSALPLASLSVVQTSSPPSITPRPPPPPCVSQTFLCFLAPVVFQQRKKRTSESGLRTEPGVIIVYVGRHACMSVYPAHSWHCRHTAAPLPTRSSASPPSGREQQQASPYWIYLVCKILKIYK